MVDQPSRQQTTIPSDDELRKLWLRAERLTRPWRGSLARRLGFSIADNLEARGVTDADIDRVMGKSA